MRYLYKYPLNAYPYNDLVATNRARSRYEPEYELIDTGIFDKNEYCDVEVEYAKADAEDLLIQITVHNRSAQAAKLTVLPTLWFRNTWDQGSGPKPQSRPTQRKLGCTRAIPSLVILPCSATGPINWCSPRTKQTQSSCSNGPTDPLTPSAASTAM